ncbi:MAG: tetratricopeptide repeat protein [Ignavibacteriae bacterium]|nr:tetratricopeptide repeat protein [Ignavibacteriota bacterium]MCB9220936.1 tetratricopeptide repeat protein [Ignavibacteria bacterium]
MKRLVVASLFLFIGAVLLQGFQCASQEMNSAKMDYQKGKFDEAIENIRKELKKNPKNEDAHILHAQILFKKGDYDGAANVIAESRDYIKSKKNKEQAAYIETQILSTAYSTAYRNYQMYFQNKDKNYLENSLKAADLSLKLRPQLFDLFNLKGRVYEELNDDSKAIESYESFIEANNDEYEFAKETSLNLDMFREEALSIIGQPTESKTAILDSTKGVTTITDRVMYNGNEIYLHSIKESSAESNKVTGWRLNLPEEWRSVEKFQYNPINIDPYAALAQKYYSNKKYDDAIRNLNYLITLKPSNKEASGLKIQILQETGNTDKAIAELEEATKISPENKRYWLQFGDLLSSMGKYDEAISKYEAALRIDPNYDYALYNIASAYKNKAGSLQKIEQEKLEKDPKYQIKTENYFPDLEKSAEYYTRTSQTEQFTDNHNVLLQLANIYQVIENKEKLDETLKKLDEVEFMVEQNEKRAFYLDLLKLYSTMKNETKTQLIQKKLENLK